MKNNIKKLVILAMILAIATLLNYVESLLPNLIPLPGVKLGLANTLNLIVLYFFGKKEYFTLGFLRVILVSILFTGLFSSGFYLSLFGFILSSISVVLLSLNKKISIFTLSIFSAIFHSIGQILCAMILYMTKDGSSIYLLGYLPILICISSISGIIISFISLLAIERLEKTSIFR